MELEKRLQQLGATDLLTLSQVLNALIEQHEDAKSTAWRVRMPNTAYNAGDKVIVPGAGNFDKILRCETAGTTADAEFPEDYNALEVGSAIPDGTVEWGVVDLVTFPDIAGAPVVSVNGKTGGVVLTAQNVGADSAGTAASKVSAHNSATDAHKALFDNHRAEMASNTASGHVKIDSETIIAENGVIKVISSQQSKQLASEMPNKAQIDFSNVTAPVRAFRDMVTKWLSPNYAAGVDAQAAYSSGYTAPSDGWLYVRINKSGMAVYINDAEVSYGYESSSEMCCFVPVLAGQILTLRIKRTQAIIDKATEPIIFYPQPIKR